MFTEISDAEIRGQYAELLPARTVMSVHRAGIGDVLGGNGTGAAGNQGGGASKAPVLDLYEWLNHPGTADPDTAAAGAGAAGASSTD